MLDSGDLCECNTECSVSFFNPSEKCGNVCPTREGASIGGGGGKGGGRDFYCNTELVIMQHHSN